MLEGLNLPMGYRALEDTKERKEVVATVENGPYTVSCSTCPVTTAAFRNEWLYS